MPLCYLLSSSSGVSPIPVHDESDMLWDGTEREQVKDERRGERVQSVQYRRDYRCRRYLLRHAASRRHVFVFVLLLSRLYALLIHVYRGQPPRLAILATFRSSAGTCG